MYLRISRIAAVLVASTLFASAAAAQQQRGFCFRGQPLAKCRAFAIFEVTGAARLAGTTHADPYLGRERDLTEWIAWDVGAMRNRDSSHAIGGSLSIGGSGGGTRIALKARRRTWLSNRVTLDVSAGPLVAQQQAADLSGTRQGYGATGEVTLGALDLVGVTLAADAIHVQNRNASALYVGAKVGSWGAVVGSAVALLGTIALAYALRDFN